MRINFRINTVFSISAVFLFAFVLNGCKDPIVKDSSLVNGPNDFLNLNTTDTFTVISKTIADPPYSAAGVSNGIVGSMDDPIFGKVVCGFYTQCRLSKDGSVFSDNPVVDSCVLSLYYYDSYGKNTKPVNIAVYEVTESMDPLNTSYLTNSTFSVNGSPIGVAYNFVPNYTDSVTTISGTEAPHAGQSPAQCAPLRSYLFRNHSTSFGIYSGFRLYTVCSIRSWNKSKSDLPYLVRFT